MTDDVLEVPQIIDLSDLPVDVSPTDEPGVVAVTAYARNGDTATLVWDEFARSVTIRWMTAEVENVRLERELATKVSIIQNHGAIEFRAWLRASELAGQVFVRIADKVSISDAILRM